MVDTQKLSINAGSYIARIPLEEQKDLLKLPLKDLPKASKEIKSKLFANIGEKNISEKIPPSIGNKPSENIKVYQSKIIEIISDINDVNILKKVYDYCIDVVKNPMDSLKEKTI